MSEGESNTAFGQSLSGAQLVVQALLGEGVDTIFGITGSHVIAIHDALRDTPQIRHVTCRHENNAALMAEAYARLSGKPGIVVVTAGPGALNGLSGIGQAYATAAPVVMITGAVPAGAKREVFHGLDDPTFLHQAFSAVTKRSIRIPSATDIPRVLAEAFSLATSGRPGPVHIEIEESVLKTVVPNAEVYRPSERQRHPENAALMDQVVAMLRTATRPTIVAGRGVLSSSASAELAQVAEILGAPVIWSGDGTSALSMGHPLCLGPAGAFQGQNTLSGQLLREADVVVGVGLRPNAAYLEPLLSGLPGKIVMLAFDDEQVPHEGAAITYTVELKPALQELAERLKPFARPAGPSLLAAIEANKAANLAAFKAAIDPCRDRTPVHFGLVIEELAKYVTPSTVVVGDIGNHNHWGSYLFRMGAERYLQVGSWAAMGYALPGAIGAKVAAPNDRVIAITGDGSFLMNSADFATAAQNKLDIVYVVLNDGLHGMVGLLSRRAFGRSYAIEIEPADFVKYAESFGATGVRIERAADIPAAVARAFATKGPVIIEAICDGYSPYVGAS